MVPARFTERARQIINYAHEEAIKLNHSQVDTEHLLLGLIHEGLRDGQGIAVSALQDLGVSLDSLEMEVIKFWKRTSSFPLSQRGIWQDISVSQNFRNISQTCLCKFEKKF